MGSGLTPTVKTSLLHGRFLLIGFGGLGFRVWGFRV